MNDNQKVSWASWVAGHVDEDEHFVFIGQIVETDKQGYALDILWVCEHQHTTRDEAVACAQAEHDRRQTEDLLEN